MYIFSYKLEILSNSQELKTMRVHKIIPNSHCLKKFKATELFYPITSSPKDKIESLMLSTNSDTITYTVC
jgi:hypothetical protein